MRCRPERSNRSTDLQRALIARREAHLVFDQLWRSAMELECYEAIARARGRRGWRARRRVYRTARRRAYAWLAVRLGLSAEECHFRLFSIRRCRRVIRICAGVTAEDIRAWALSR